MYVYVCVCVNASFSTILIDKLFFIVCFTFRSPIFECMHASELHTKCIIN